MDKQRAFAAILAQGVSISEACRRLGVDRKTGHWWKNGRRVERDGILVTVRQPVVGRRPVKPASGRFLREDERVVIADRVREGRSARAIAAELGRAVSTIARELKRNAGPDGGYRPHAAQALAVGRRARPRLRLFEREEQLRTVAQGLLDRRWSPEQVAHELRVTHGRTVSVETIYQALYGQQRVLQRQAGQVLRTGRPHRRPRRRGDQRRPRFVVPITRIDERPVEVNDREVPGHWEGDLIVVSYNRSAIGTLVERTTRFTILVPLHGPSRAEGLRDHLIRIFAGLPPQLRRSLTWDQAAR